jgi:hypothetical protein
MQTSRDIRAAKLTAYLVAYIWGQKVIAFLPTEPNSLSILTISSETKLLNHFRDFYHSMVKLVQALLRDFNPQTALCTPDSMPRVISFALKTIFRW